MLCSSHRTVEKEVNQLVQRCSHRDTNPEHSRFTRSMVSFAHDCHNGHRRKDLGANRCALQMSLNSAPVVSQLVEQYYLRCHERTNRS